MRSVRSRLFFINRDDLLEMLYACKRALNYQRIAALPHIKPLPKAASTTRSPSFILPSSQASQRPMGTEAAVVLPYLWILETICLSVSFISF